MTGKGVELVSHACSHNFSLLLVFDCVKSRGHFSKEERKMQICVSLQKKEAGHRLCCAQFFVYETVLIKKLCGKVGRILCRKD
jgi:hypothetical protein